MALPTISSNSPGVGSISWTAFSIQFGGVGYGVAAGSTSSKYVWWEYRNGAPVLLAGNTFPSALKPEDLLLFLNKGGIGVLVPTSAVVDGSLIVPESILAGSIGADQINSGHLQSDSVGTKQLQSESVTTENLAVGSVSDNLVANGSFEEFDENGHPLGWEVTTQTNGSVQVVEGVASSGAHALRMLATTTSANLRIRQKRNQWIPVSAASGRQWYISARAGCSVATSGDGFYLRAEWLDAAGTYLTYTDIKANQNVTSTFLVYEGQATPPEAARYMRLNIFWYLPNTLANLYVDEVTAREVLVSAHIGNGAITTPKLQATAINGMTITGAIHQSSENANEGVKFTDQGFFAYNSATNQRTFFIDAATGEVEATGTYETTSIEEIEFDSSTNTTTAALGSYVLDSHTDSVMRPALRFTRTSSNDALVREGSVWFDGANVNLSTYVPDDTGYGNLQIGAQGLSYHGGNTEYTDPNGTVHVGDNVFMLGAGGDGWKMAAGWSGPGQHSSVTNPEVYRESAISLVRSTPYSPGHLDLSVGTFEYNASYWGEARLSLHDGGDWEFSSRDAAGVYKAGLQYNSASDQFTFAGAPVWMYEKLTLDQDLSVGGGLYVGGSITGYSGQNLVIQSTVLPDGGFSGVVAGRYYTAPMGSPGLVMLNTSTGTPGIWFSSDGSLTGDQPAIYADTSYNMYFRGRQQGAHAIVFPTGARIEDDLEYWNPPTSTFGANLGIASSPKDRLYKLTSASRFKLAQQEQTYEKALRLLNVIPKTWFDKFQAEAYASHLDGNGPELDQIPVLRRIPGVVAEDVLAAGLPEYVTYDRDGNIEGVAYDRLWTLLILLVKDLFDTQLKHHSRLVAIETHLGLGE